MWQYGCRSDRAERQCTGKQMRVPPFHCSPLPPPPLKTLTPQNWGEIRPPPPDLEVNFQNHSFYSASWSSLPTFGGYVFSEPVKIKTPFLETCQNSSGVVFLVRRGPLGGSILGNIWGSRPLFWSSGPDLGKNSKTWPLSGLPKGPSRTKNTTG